MTRAEIEINIQLCDRLNPSFGYQVRITDSRNGNLLCQAACDPFRDKDILTASDALEFAASWMAEQKLS